jgi:hypothetical protein
VGSSTMGSFIVVSWLKSGWQAFIANPCRSMVVGGMYGIYRIAMWQVDRLVEVAGYGLWFVIFKIIIDLAFASWAMYFMLCLYRRVAWWSGKWSVEMRRYARAFMVWIASGVAVAGGGILLVVPGVIVAVMFSQSVLLTMDKGLEPADAFRASVRMTQGHKWAIFCLAAVTITGGELLAWPFWYGMSYSTGKWANAMLFAGFIPWLACVLVLVPVSLLSSCVAYGDMLRLYKENGKALDELCDNRGN